MKLSLASFWSSSCGHFKDIPNSVSFLILRGLYKDLEISHCKYFDCTQYSFWQCYVSHCNLAVHVTAQNSNWSQTELLNVIECHGYSRWLWSLLPNYSGKCNTANDCKLAVNICSVGSNPFSLSKYYYILLTSFYEITIKWC